MKTLFILLFTSLSIHAQLADSLKLIFSTEYKYLFSNISIDDLKNKYVFINPGTGNNHYQLNKEVWFNGLQNAAFYLGLKYKNAKIYTFYSTSINKIKDKAYEFPYYSQEGIKLGAAYFAVESYGLEARYKLNDNFEIGIEYNISENHIDVVNYLDDSIRTLFRQIFSFYTRNENIFFSVPFKLNLFKVNLEFAPGFSVISSGQGSLLIDANDKQYSMDYSAPFIFYSRLGISKKVLNTFELGVFYKFQVLFLKNNYSFYNHSLIFRLGLPEF